MFVDDMIKTIIKYPNGTYLKVEFENGQLVLEGRIDTFFETDNGLEMAEEGYKEYYACAFLVEKIINNLANIELHVGELIEMSVENEPTLILLEDGTAIWKKSATDDALCQYEFQFQNEYMNKLEKEIGDVLGVVLDKDNPNRKDIGQHKFILRKKDTKNFMLFSANGTSYVYLLIVRCEKIYEESIRNILLKLCNEIEEDYGENHRREVSDVFLRQDNRLNVLEREYSIMEFVNKN